MIRMQVFGAVIFILSCHSVWKASLYVYAYRGYVCEPHNSTQLTGCTNQHWIHISSELYAPKVVGGSSCDVNLTGRCNNYVQDHGLNANCNGPVRDESSPCREEVDFESVKFVQCLADADDLAAIVDYLCVPDTSVLDMCSNISISQTSSFSTLYLASPGFPSSVADGQMCSCSIQGTRIKMEAIDVNVRANLQWEEASSFDGVDAVLSIENGDVSVLNSNEECTNCQNIRIHNTFVISELDGAAVNISLSYSDFGLPNQNVWMKIYGLEPMLNITCSSHPLPSNRIITTTTTSTTTTTTIAPPTTATSTTAPPTTATSTTAPPTTATSTTAPPTLATASTSTQRTTKSTDNPVLPVTTRTQQPNLATQASQSTSGTSNTLGQATGSTGRGRGHSTDQKKSDGGNDDTVIIVVLLLVMVILIAVTAVLCVVLYRRRDKFGSIHMKSAVVSWFERTFQRRHHAASNEEQNDMGPPAYDDIIAVSSADGLQMEEFRGEDVYAVPTEKSKSKHEPKDDITAVSSDGLQKEEFRGEDVYAVPTKKSKSKHEPKDDTIAVSSDDLQQEEFRGEDVYAVPIKKSRPKHEPNEVTASETRPQDDGAVQEAALHAVANDQDPWPLIDPGMYASHQQLVGDEVAKMKMERSLNSKKKSSDMSKDKKHRTNKDNTQGTSVHAKQTEGCGEDTDLEPKIKAKAQSNHTTDTTSKPAIPDDDENKEKNQKKPDGDNMHYKKRKTHEKAYSKKVRDDKLKDEKNTEKESHENAVKLSPEEDQMFEDLGIPQPSIFVEDEKKLDENSAQHENKIKVGTDASRENPLYYDDDNDYSFV